MVEKKTQVLEMFMDNHTPYEIMEKTGLSFKEITHYIRESEEAKARHKRALAKAQREHDAMAL